MAGSDNKVSYITATGTVFAGPARITGLHYHSGGSTGKIVLRDGGASGAVVATFDFHSTSTGDMHVPDEGIRFQTDVHATLTNMTSVSFFYK